MYRTTEIQLYLVDEGDTRGEKCCTRYCVLNAGNFSELDSNSHREINYFMPQLMELDETRYIPIVLY